MSCLSRFQVKCSQLRIIILVLLIALSFTFGGLPRAWADSVSTNGTASGEASGTSDQSVKAEFSSDSSSEASSVGEHFDNGRSEAGVAAGVQENSSAGDNSVQIFSGAGASVSHEKKEYAASAGAETSGTTGDLNQNASVIAASSKTAEGISASANASNGSVATATNINGLSATSFVPNGTTSNYTALKGTVNISVSIAPDGNYAIAQASQNAVNAAVGLNANTSLSTASIQQLIHAVLYAEASASDFEISASASASINGAAKNLAAQANAAGFSAATAKITRNTENNTITLTVSGGNRCDKFMTKRELAWSDCRVFRKTIKLGKNGFVTIGKKYNKGSMFVQPASYVFAKHLPKMTLVKSFAHKPLHAKRHVRHLKKHKKHGSLKHHLNDRKHHKGGHLN